ncbi:MAG: hypothetical protein QM703_19410 [Gemmatales bacterium]
MSVILVDLGNDKHDVMVSNAGWRDTVAVMRSFAVLEEEHLQRLETLWLGEQLTHEEANEIGKALIAGPLMAINWSDNVYPPVEFWTDPCKQPLVEYDLSTYWPSWLRAFAGFCITCRGFICN